MSYVAHIVEQIQHNLAFLVENGHMNQQDADLVISRLPGQALENAVSVLPQAPVASVGPVAAPRRVLGPLVPPVTTSKTVKAKALWTYNENGEDPDDLSFRTGDIIEIIEETNTDWWKGRFNGKEGLFPSNHVEKVLPGDTNTNGRAVPPLPTRAVAPPSYNPAGTMATTAPPSEKAAYRPFGAAHQQVNTPPPAGAGAVNSVGLQEAAGQDKKKSKYGSLGNTMAHSAAGGVGFGAGAAIGGGLVRAIF